MIHEVAAALLLESERAYFVPVVLEQLFLEYSNYKGKLSSRIYHHQSGDGDIGAHMI